VGWPATPAPPRCALRPGLVSTGRYNLGVIRNVLNWVSRREDDPLPLALTGGGLALTGVGIVGGLIIDAAGLLANVLSNFVLLGPALVISNIVVVHAQRLRGDHRAAPLLELLGWVALDAVKAANDLNRLLRVADRTSVPERIQTESVTNLALIAETLALAVSSVQRALDTPGIEKGDSIYIDGPEMTLPNFSSMDKLVGLLDREYSCPMAVLLASAAADWADKVSVDFVFGASRSELGDSPQDHNSNFSIYDPKIGFGEIESWLNNGIRRPGELKLGAISYFTFVLQILEKSQRTIESVSKAMPERLLKVI